MTEQKNLCEAVKRVRLYGGGVGTVRCDLPEDHQSEEGTQHTGVDDDGVRRVWGV